MSIDDIWYDDEAGPIVRLYAITGGRTEAPAGDFTLSTTVQRVPGPCPAASCRWPSRRSCSSRAAVSVCEIAARLGLPLGPVRVILADLRDARLITVPRSRDAAERPSMSLLQQVLSGLNSL
jgi:hypothetical protein